MNNLNVFTCCNGIYKDFIPLFILSNLLHNKNSFVEVGVDDMDYKEIIDSMKILKNFFGDKFLIYKLNQDFFKYKNKYDMMPNSVRFITTPKIKTKYVYISDVDIINLQENLEEIHINNMKKTKLPYSNIVRPNKKMLTGLHFTPYENYYPIPNFDDLCNKKLLSHDETFLYSLIEKRFPNFNYTETFRPLHGIHISLNRTPHGQPGWGIEGWKKEWNVFRKTEIFLKIEPTLTNMINDKIKLIDQFSK